MGVSYLDKSLVAPQSAQSCNRVKLFCLTNTWLSNVEAMVADCKWPADRQASSEDCY